MADLESIQKKIIAFRNERDWQQFRKLSVKSSRRT
jgi:hypothetical protein